MRHTKVEVCHGIFGGDASRGAPQAVHSCAYCRQAFKGRHEVGVFQVVSNNQGRISVGIKAKGGRVAMEDQRMCKFHGSVARARIRRENEAVPLAARCLTFEVWFAVPGL